MEKESATLHSFSALSRFIVNSHTIVIFRAQ
jgi:hypothetical protein